MNRLNSSLLICLLLLCVSATRVSAKSRHAITDTEVRKKKMDCYADIESGLWGSRCKSSTTAKENCALRCLSLPCYELIYENDPLEEGEKDLVRSQEYKYCMHKLGESGHCNRRIIECLPWLERVQDECCEFDLRLEVLPRRLSLGESLDGIRGAFDI